MVVNEELVPMCVLKEVRRKPSTYFLVNPALSEKLVADFWEKEVQEQW